MHGLDRFRPAFQAVEVGQQLLSVGRDPHEPLRNFAAFDQGARAPAAAVNHLLVGKDGLVDRIPVHDRRFAVHHVPCIELREEPLFPAVVTRVTGRELARPVITKAQALQLAAHVIDIGAGPTRRWHIVLNCGVFRRQAKRIPAHGLKDILTEHTLVASDDVPYRVVADMPHVQPATGIGKHAQAIEFFARRVFVHGECLGLLPALLNAWLDFGRVVAIFHTAAAGVGRREYPTQTQP